MIGKLRAANAEYDKKIAFVYVDWDKHGASPVSRDLRVGRQSTLIMITDKGEAGRLVAQTSSQAIQALLDKAPARSGNAPSCT